MKSHSPRNMVIFLCRRPNYPIQFHPSDQTSVVSLVRHWQRGPWTQPEPEPTAQATAQPTARIEMEPRRRRSWSGTPRDARTTHACDHWRSPMECETSENVRIEDPLDPISATQGSKGSQSSTCCTHSLMGSAKFQAPQIHHSVLQIDTYT